MQQQQLYYKKATDSRTLYRLKPRFAGSLSYERLVSNSTAGKSLAAPSVQILSTTRVTRLGDFSPIG
jgi:hypothetical protein